MAATTSIVSILPYVHIVSVHSVQAEWSVACKIDTAHVCQTVTKAQISGGKFAAVRLVEFGEMQPHFPQLET